MSDSQLFRAAEMRPALLWLTERGSEPGAEPLMGAAWISPSGWVEFVDEDGPSAYPPHAVRRLDWEDES